MLLQRNYRSATCCLGQCNHSPVTGLQCNLLISQCNLLQSQCVLIIFDPMPRKPKSNGQYHTFVLYALQVYTVALQVCFGATCSWVAFANWCAYCSGSATGASLPLLDIIIIVITLLLLIILLIICHFCIDHKLTFAGSERGSRSAYVAHNTIDQGGRS